MASGTAGRANGGLCPASGFISDVSAYRRALAHDKAIIECRPPTSYTCVIDRPTYRCGRVWKAASVNGAISAALSTRQTTTNTLQPVNADNIARRSGRLSISATIGLLLGAGVASIWW